MAMSELDRKIYKMECELDKLRNENTALKLALDKKKLPSYEEADEELKNTACGEPLIIVGMHLMYDYFRVKLDLKERF